MSKQAHYAVALLQIKGLGLHTLKQLLTHYATPEAVYAAPVAELLRTPKVRLELLKQIVQKSTFSEADRILSRCEQLGVRPIFLQDEAYPDLLQHIHLPPMLVYVTGEVEAMHKKPAVALVGTRRMTSYGARHVDGLCELLAPHRGSIICGLGEGVERCATQAALRHGLSPVVVYPAGLQHPYPSTAPVRLIEQAREAGCLLSECPPDEPLQRHAFLARHRIIIGLSQQIVLIESRKKGGAMQLAQYAQSENRDVQALPGDIDKSRSEGANLLIRRNIAQVLSSHEDLLCSLNLQQVSANSSALQGIQEQLSEEEKRIINTLGTSEKGIHIDFIFEQTALPIGQLSILLFNLECHQVIEVLPGNNYRLCTQMRGRDLC